MGFAPPGWVVISMLRIGCGVQSQIVHKGIDGGLAQLSQSDQGSHTLHICPFALVRNCNQFLLLSRGEGVGLSPGPEIVVALPGGGRKSLVDLLEQFGFARR